MTNKILICALTFIIIAISVTTEAKEETGAAKTANTDQVQHKVLSFNLEGMTKEGAKKWDVKGESAEAVSETEVKLNNITAKSYGKDAEATITADKGVYNKAKNNVRLEENVKATIENTKGFAQDYVGFTDDMASSSKKPKPDKADKPGKTKTVITCDAEVQFDYEKNQAYFNKNVKVVSDDGRIEADKITVNLDPATKKIKEMIAEGNVKIARGENITYSEKATYIEAEKKIILTGKPQLVIYREGSMEEGFFGSDETKKDGKR